MRKTVVPLLLILSCPPLAILMWYINVHLGGSVLELWALYKQDGFFPTIYQIWRPIFFGSTTAWTMIFTFAAFQLAFMKLLPGKIVEGPITPEGNIPLYKSNGVFAFALTLTLFLLATEGLHLFSATIIYDHFGSILGALNLLSFGFCTFLYLKGRIAPSSTDSGSSGNVIFDYYWGMELYPRVLGWDLKMFTNCRFGMMSWSLIILSFAFKQRELYGTVSDSMMVSVALQLLYIAKFFIWEDGYLRSMDIMHDRAGYYICWGCLVWVPSIYASPALYLVNHPNHLGWPIAGAIFAVGAIAIIVNYLADRQRQRFRSTEGNCLVWNRKPTAIIAKYTTHKGDTKYNLLLASGWWGIGRHFHYVPEIMAALCWTLPALFQNFLPYFYLTFLTLLLINRSFRQEQRCQEKYGASWNAYCEIVPFKMVPYVY